MHHAPRLEPVSARLGLEHAVADEKTDPPLRYGGILVLAALRVGRASQRARAQRVLDVGQGAAGRLGRDLEGDAEPAQRQRPARACRVPVLPVRADPS